MHLPLRLQQGVGRRSRVLRDGKGPAAPEACKTNTLLLNGHWITNDLRLAATETFPAYQGHGVWGFDPVAKTYVNTWVDTNDRAVRTDYWFWYEKEQTMAWSSKQSDGEGHFIDYRMTEEFRATRGSSRSTSWRWSARRRTCWSASPSSGALRSGLAPTRGPSARGDWDPRDAGPTERRRRRLLTNSRLMPSPDGGRRRGRRPATRVAATGGASARSSSAWSRPRAGTGRPSCTRAGQPEGFYRKLGVMRLLTAMARFEDQAAAIQRGHLGEA